MCDLRGICQLASGQIILYFLHVILEAHIALCSTLGADMV